MARTIRSLIFERARSRCEYCHMPQACDDVRFQIDHVIAQQHTRNDDVANLALACVSCNQFKGPNLSGIDPVTGTSFNYSIRARNAGADTFDGTMPFSKEKRR